MKCRKVQKSLIEYTEGGLPEERREATGAHLEGCAECSACAAKLEFSRAALTGLQPVAIPDAAANRVLESIRGAITAKRHRPVGLLRSPRALALAAGAAALIIGVAVVVGISTGNHIKEKRGETGFVEESARPGTATAPDQEKPPGAVTQKESKDLVPQSLGTVPVPLAKVTANDYTPESLKGMFDTLGVKKEFASRYTMGDAINLRRSYEDKVAGDFVNLGLDAPLLEAMFSYITAGEPVMLPCYVEKARFKGQGVWILALSAPPRGSESVKLTRTEIWVMNPDKFPANPDSSVVFFLEMK